MIKNNAVIVILITIFVAFAVFGTGSALKYMENPSLCSKCHAMGPFYESFTNSKDYPLIQTHKDEGLSCIDCHSPPGQKNRDHVRITIMGEILSHIAPVNFAVNKSQLKVNCIKCHDIDTAFDNNKINPHAGVQSCEASCHIAHENLKLADIGVMDCANCHVEPDISGKHTNLDCIGCHPTHGRIPSCTGCHSTHDDSNVKVENVECLECHGKSAHVIEIGTYGPQSNISSSVCGGCHPYQKINLDFSGHGLMGTCISCHPTHGTFKQCAICHKTRGTEYYKEDIHGKHSFLYGSGKCSSCHVERGLKNLPTGCTNCHTQDPHTL